MTQNDGGSERTPIHEMARRLEYVRQHIAGCRSTREFWLSLGFEVGGGGPDHVSYAAARRYHSDREAPAAYLTRVVDRYPTVRLEWLVAGRGSPTHADGHEEEPQHATIMRNEGWGRMYDALKTAFPAAERNEVCLPMLDVWAFVQPDRWGTPIAEPENPRDDGKVEAGRRVGEAFRAPLDLLGINFRDLKIWQLDAYARLLAEALRLVLGTMPHHSMVYRDAEAANAVNGPWSARPAVGETVGG